MKFKKNMDVDGFVPDMSDETTVSEVVYQVTLTTSPGLGRFEASLTYSIKLDTFSVKVCFSSIYLFTYLFLYYIEGSTLKAKTN